MGQKAGESDIYDETHAQDMYLPAPHEDGTLQKKLRVVWPEDRLMWEYFRKHPEARLIPYELNSFDPPFVKRFALRQHKLMQNGCTKTEAYEKVAEELEPEKQDALRCVHSCISAAQRHGM